MYVMHNKTETFITQLRHMTHGERRNSAKYQVNQQAYIRQVPVVMLKQKFEVTATSFHAAMQTFVPLIDSVVDRCR